MITKDNLPQWEPLLQALREGKQLQFWHTYDERWEDCGGIMTDISPARYRIKPEPRRFWVNVYPYGHDHIAHPSKDTAERFASTGRIECIEVVEVMKP